MNSEQIDSADVESSISDGYGSTVRPNPDSLDEYEYDHGDEFKNRKLGGENRDEVWVVGEISWYFQTTWLVDREDPTTREHHRRYTLVSRETFDRQEVSEHDLKRGHWERVGGDSKENGDSE